MYLVRLFFIADFRLVLGDTPLSLAGIAEIVHIRKSALEKGRPETREMILVCNHTELVNFLISIDFASLMPGVGLFVSN